VAVAFTVNDLCHDVQDPDHLSVNQRPKKTCNSLSAGRAWCEVMATSRSRAGDRGSSHVERTTPESGRTLSTSKHT
jgi:hypothetical protein